MEKKRMKILKREVKNWKLKEEKLLGKDPCFFFFFSLFKMTKICFGSTKIEIFYQEKAFHAGKKNQEKWLCPLRKIFLLRPWV